MEGEPAIKKIKLDSEENGVPKEDNTKTDASGEETTQYKKFFEKNVGIEEYISDHPGFHAIIKQRYSDFLVNEVDEDGKVVVLTNKDPPPDTPETVKAEPMKVEPVKVEPGSETQETNSATDEAPAPQKEEVVVTDWFRSLISDDYLEKLKEMKASSDSQAHVLIEVGNDKDLRCQMHQAIRQAFPGFESNTTDIDEKKYIKVTKPKAAQKGQKRDNRYFRPKWTKDGDYCRFVLYKENKDTMDAVWLMSKFLRVNRGLFHYAGTKDRRAKTTQEVTAYRIEAEKLLGLNTTLRQIEIGNIRYVKKALRLGQLSGNRFNIVLRNVMAEDSVLETAMTSLRNIGFINYYGMQRFGTTVIPTYFIGLALLKNKWQEAVELILKPRPGEPKPVAKWRDEWWKSRNSKKSLDRIPPRMGIEKQILTGLRKFGDKNYSNAFNTIPRNTKTMYLHSYQSYVWNRTVSRRIRTYGLKPIIGDLVLPSDAKLEVETEEDKETEEEPPTRPQPVIVDETNISSYTVEDVVLPLPGFDVVYPNNEVKDWMEEILSEDEMSIAIMKTKNKGPYSLSGTYRKILQRPKDVEWQTFRYDDVTIPLSLSDSDKLKELPEPVSVEEGKFKALRIQMTLPQSCYATMALREIVKTDTSSGHQTTLNPKDEEESTDTPDDKQEESTQ